MEVELAKVESMVTKVQFVTIDESSEDQRLDNFLLKTLKNVPKSLIYRIIRKGEVRVNKGRAKPENRLQIGDSVRIPPVKVPEAVRSHKPSQSLIQSLENAVVYESEQLLVVNKPSGLAVHGGSGVNLGLIEALRASPNAPKFLELVHRLDKDTSGCVMVAKKRSMLKYLQDLLRRETGVDKRYLALVEGKWPKRKTLVNLPLLKREAHGGERHVAVNHEQGKPSKTAYRVIETFAGATLVEAKPITGRTHQIRVHCQQNGHPIIGDSKYGAENVNKVFKKQGIKRLFLHAYALSLPLQNGETLELQAPLPEELERSLTRLR